MMLQRVALLISSAFWLGWIGVLGRYLDAPPY